MANFTKPMRDLQNAYQVKLQQIHKNNFESFKSPLEYFINYLRYLRDFYLLQAKNLDTIGQDNLELAALITAISEYEKSESCIYNYYTEVNGVVTRRSDTESETEVLEKYSQEKTFHLNTFWSLVQLNIESWGNVKF